MTRDRLVGPGCDHDGLVDELPAQQIEQDCEGCQSDLLLLHNGTYVRLMDWQVQEPQRFVDLIAQPTAAFPSW